MKVKSIGFLSVALGLWLGAFHALAQGPVTAWGRGAIFCNYCDSGQTGVPGDLTNAIAVAGGWNHSLALRADGTISAWGESYLGATSVPAGLSNVVAIAAGDNDSLALLNDATVMAWGYNGYGETSVPAGLSNVVAIAAGNFFNLALRSDGTVAAWGDDHNGEVTAAKFATGIKAIAASSGNTDHAMGLRTNGTVVLWGSSSPPPPAGLSNVISIACGADHYLALKDDGTVVAWGDNSYGQTNVPAGLSNVVAIAAGRAYSVAVKADKTLVAWGTSDYGLNVAPQGLKNITSVSGGGEHVLVIHDGAPCLLQWPTNQSIYTGMSAAFFGATAPTTSGASFQWQFGGTNLPVTGTSLSISNAQLPDAGTYSLALTNAFGAYLSSAVLNVATSAPVFVSEPLDQLVPAGTNAMFSATVAGTVPLSYQWRCNSTNIPAETNATLIWPNAQMAQSGFVFTLVASNQFGATTSSNAVLNVVPSLAGVTPAALTTNGGAVVTFNSVVIGQGPFTYQWQFNGTNLDGATNSSLVLSNALVVESGNYSVVVSNAFGDVVSMNASLTVIPWITMALSPTNVNYGAGTIVSFSFNVGGLSPVSYQWTQNGDPFGGPGPGGLMQVISPDPSWSGVYNVTAHDATTLLTSSNVTLTINPLALTKQPSNAVAWVGGSARMSLSAIGVTPIGYQWRHWGVNVPGANTNFLVFTNVQNDQYGAYSVLVTNTYTNIISATATLYPSEVVVWGGVSSETNLTVGLTNIVAISAGGSGCLALSSNGAPIGWPAAYFGPSNLIAIAGSNPSMGLQPDGKVVYSYLGPVAGLTNVAAIAPRYSPGYLALQTNGNVIGSAATMAGLTNMVAIAEGAAHCLALRADGTVVAWGNNVFGQTNVPTNLTNVTAIAAGFYHNLALLGDGTVVAWGRNSEHQTNVPAGLNNVVAIAAGGYHSLALKADGTVLAWGSNVNHQTNAPPTLSNVVAIAAGENLSMALVGGGPPVTRTTVSNMSFGADTFSLSLPSQSGRVFVLQHKDALSDTNWTSGPLVPGTGEELWLTDPAATNMQRFYRVERW